MALFDKINIKIAKGLGENKYKIFLLIFLLSVILMLTFILVDGADFTSARFEYSFFYIWVSYFFIIAGGIFFNMKVLVPRFLLTGKLIWYSLSIVGCIFIILFLIILTQSLYFYPTEEGDTAVSPDSAIVGLLGNLLSTGMIIVSTSVYALFRGWAAYSRQVNELETTTKEAELQQLKSQINPHFLFNTINNVNIKVEKEPKLAYDMITKLEDLLRYQLTGTSNEKVFLKDDIAFFYDYLELESTRRNRFSYSIETDDAILDLKVHPLLFISFIENAVKHSLSARGESIINITFKKENDRLHFYCENSKSAVSDKQKPGGLGLKNVKRRLELLYGNDYTLDIADSADKYIVNLYLKI